MSDQIPVGEMQNPETEKAHQPKPRGTVVRDFSIAVGVVALCVFGMRIVDRLVRFSDAMDNRVSVIELTQKVSQLQARTVEFEKKADAESQRLTGAFDIHNKLIQALNITFTSMENRLGALESKMVAIDAAKTNVVGKVEKEKKR